MEEPGVQRSPGGVRGLPPGSVAFYTQPTGDEGVVGARGGRSQPAAQSSRCHGSALKALLRGPRCCRRLWRTLQPDSGHVCSRRLLGRTRQGRAGRRRPPLPAAGGAPPRRTHTGDGRSEGPDHGCRARGGQEPDWLGAVCAQVRHGVSSGTAAFAACVRPQPPSTTQSDQQSLEVTQWGCLTRCCRAAAFTSLIQMVSRQPFRQQVFYPLRDHSICHRHEPSLSLSRACTLKDSRQPRVQRHLATQAARPPLWLLQLGRRGCRAACAVHAPAPPCRLSAARAPNLQAAKTKQPQKAIEIFESMSAVGVEVGCLLWGLPPRPRLTGADALATIGGGAARPGWSGAPPRGGGVEEEGAPGNHLRRVPTLRCEPVTFAPIRPLPRSPTHLATRR